MYYPKISIILPSFNVINYIQQCLDSVISQSLEDIEIICVDAGSDDGTLDILKEYEEKDSRIKLLLSDKKSYGHQMNLAFDLARGEYIGIVETDDYIKQDMFEMLYDLSENGHIDIVKGNFYHFNDEDSNNPIIVKDQSKQGLSNVKFTIHENPNILNGHPSIWAAIYNRKFLLNNDIKFMEAPKGGWVDNPFLFETFCAAKSIKYTDEPFYYYRESNPDSSSNKLSDLTLPMVRMLNNIDVIDKYGCYDENILVALYVRIFWHINDVINKPNFKEQENLLNSYFKNLCSRMDKNIIEKRLDDSSKKLFNRLCSKLNVKNSSYKNDYKVSIIMPIYNAEDAIEQSIESVINQSLDGIELICIDDGSTDNSLNLLNDYASKYDFIKVYSQDNQGSGKARNLGMNLSNGEYIGYLDADDYFIDGDAIEKLYVSAKNNNANMSTGNILHDVDNPGEFIPFKHLEYFTEDKVILPEEYGIPWSFYKSIFKKEFLVYNNIFFPDLLRGQDPVFLAEILTKVDKIYAVSTDVYAYVFYDAINRCDEFRKIYDQLLHYKIVLDYLKEPRFNKARHDFRVAFFWFIAHLNEDIIEDSLNILRDIFKDDIFMLNDIENYFYLNYGLNPNFHNLFKSYHSPKMSVIVPVDYINDIEIVMENFFNQSFKDFEIILVSNSENSINKLNNSYLDYMKVKTIYTSCVDLNELLYVGFKESSSEWCFFYNPNTKINDYTLNNLLDYTVVNDGGFIFNKSDIDEYFNIHRLVRNFNSPNFDLNSAIDSINKNSIKHPKISVIIPVYNAEPFLKEALDSVLNQTFSDIELVCVNDGSKDNSLAMLIEFAKSDYRFVLIDQLNAGCGAARNHALDWAKGDYIYFFDPDDYISPDAFERLYDNARNNDTDLVMFKIARFVDGEPVNYSAPGFDFENVFRDVDFNNFTFNYHDIKRYVMNASFAPWTKLYKKKFLDKYDDFRFPTNIAFDDAPFHVQSVLRASSISFIPAFFYFYRYNPNSIINTSSNGIDIFRICDIVEKFIKENNFYGEFVKEFDLFKITQIFNYLLSTGTEEYFMKAKEEFSKINLGNDHIIDNNLLYRFNLVLESDSLSHYLSNYYKNEINNLNNRINVLQKENRKLSSNSNNFKHVMQENNDLSLKLKVQDDVIRDNHELYSKYEDILRENKKLSIKLKVSSKRLIKLSEENRKLSIQINNLLNKKENSFKKFFSR